MLDKLFQVSTLNNILPFFAFLKSIMLKFNKKNFDPISGLNEFFLMYHGEYSIRVFQYFNSKLLNG